MWWLQACGDCSHADLKWRAICGPESEQKQIKVTVLEFSPAESIFLFKKKKNWKINKKFAVK